MTPILPGIVVGLLSIGVLLINLGQTSVFASVTSVSVVIVYLAYLFVTIPMLWHRIRRNPAHAPESANFTLGRWGLPVNIVAVVFGLFLLINVGWPRAAVYDPASQSWVLQYSAPLSVVVAIGLGIGAFAIMRRQRAGAADPPAADPPARRASVSSRAGRALISGRPRPSSGPGVLVGHGQDSRPTAVLEATMGVRPHADDPLAGSLSAAGSALVDSRGAGPNQPSNAAALATHNGAAVGYMAAGRLADAASQFEQVLDRCSLLLGLRHPDTLIVEGNLAVIYIRLGRTDEGLRLLAGNLMVRVEVLGADHPATMRATDAAAAAQRLVGRLPQALRLYKQVVGRRSRVLGPGHPDTLTSRWGLALAHTDARELTIAAAQFQAALIDAEQYCGREHPQTIALRADLARCHDALGHTEAARDGLRRAVEDSTRSLGGDHDDTRTLREDLGELEAHHPVRTERWVPT